MGLLLLPAGAAEAAVLATSAGRRQLLAELDSQAARLFAVHVLARLRRQHRCRGVPAITGRYDDRVDIGPGQQIAKIAIQLTVGVAIVFVHQSLARVAPTGLHIRNGDALYIGQG